MAESSYMPQMPPNAAEVLQGQQVKHSTKGLNVSIVERWIKDGTWVEIGKGDVTCWLGAFPLYSYRNDQLIHIEIVAGKDMTIVLRYDTVANTVRVRKIVDYDKEPATSGKDFDLVLAKIWLRPNQDVI